MGIVHTFQRLQAELGRMISNAERGERLPSEPDLARRFGVSRATLREAMRTFESQGLIIRRQGVGTFVVNRSQVIDSGLEILESIESLAKKINLDVSMGDLTIESFPADAQHASIFQCEQGYPLVRVSRVIIADARPVSFLQDVLPEDLAPEDLLKPPELRSEFSGSVLDLLLRRGSPLLSESLTEIQAEAATSKIARALQIQRGDVLLVFIARLLDVDGRIVDFSTSHFLPGYFHFHVIRRLEKSSPISTIIPKEETEK